VGGPAGSRQGPASVRIVGSGPTSSRRSRLSDLRMNTALRLALRLDSIFAASEAGLRDELGACCFPVDRLSVAFSDIARAPFQFGRPCCSDLLIWFFEAREQFFGDPRPIAVARAVVLRRPARQSTSPTSVAGRVTASEHQRSAPTTTRGWCAFLAAAPSPITPGLWTFRKRSPSGAL
jgi:hypothetical protein